MKMYSDLPPKPLHRKTFLGYTENEYQSANRAVEMNFITYWGRMPNATEKEYWLNGELNQMAGRRLTDLASYLKANAIDILYGQITTLWQNTFGVEPLEQDFKYWAEKIRIYGFDRVQAYFNAVNDAVTKLYQTYLQRNPDTSEKLTWIKSILLKGDILNTAGVNVDNLTVELARHSNAYKTIYDYVYYLGEEKNYPDITGMAKETTVNVKNWVSYFKNLFNERRAYVKRMYDAFGVTITEDNYAKYVAYFGHNGQNALYDYLSLILIHEKETQTQAIEAEKRRLAKEKAEKEKFLKDIQDSIIAVYNEMLKRNPAGNELKIWAEQIGNGTLTLDDLRSSIADSDEYKNKGKKKINVGWIVAGAGTALALLLG